MDQDKKILIKVRAIILHSGMLLTVKHSADSNYLSLPGGHLEWGEKLEECISREMVEELGVKAEVGKLFYINNYSKDNKQYFEFFFEIKNGIDYLNLENLERSHAHEIAEIKWIKPTDNFKLLPPKLEKDFKSGRLVSNETRIIA